MKRKIAEVWETDEYGLFSFIDGNREVREDRAKKIGKSFDENGRVLNPIFVNEKYGIIDGQGRYVASKERGLTIQYIKDRSFDLKSCVILNKYNTNWGIADYVNSYVEQGVPDFKYIKILFDRYAGECNIPMKVIINAIHPHLFSPKTDAIKNGMETCTVEEYERAQEKLEYLRPFLDKAVSVGGNKSAFLMGIGFAFDHPEIQNDRLKEKVISFDSFTPPAGIKSAVKMIETAYNFKNRKKVFFASDFDRFEMERPVLHKDIKKHNAEIYKMLGGKNYRNA